MPEKVKLSKDGSSIDFVTSESLPTSMKKFRQSPEIEGFYRFIFENDLQKEAYDILDRIIIERKRRKVEEKAKEKAALKEVAQREKEALKAQEAIKAKAPASNGKSVKPPSKDKGITAARAITAKKPAEKPKIKAKAALKVKPKKK